MIRFSPSVLVFAAAALCLGAPVAVPGQNADTQKKTYVHRLHLADRIRVGVYNEDDLTAVVRINANGRINLPLIQDVSVGGLTITEAQEKIEKAYKDGRFLRNPQVTVSVEEYAPREVAIYGAIKNSGRYALPVESTYTLVELITKAGGFTDIAKGNAVTVTRFNSDGTKQVFTIDVESILKGKKSGKSEDNAFLLQPEDLVNVPEALI